MVEVRDGLTSGAARSAPMWVARVLALVLAAAGALVALPAAAAPAEQGTFTGTVLLPDGGPASGVTVQLSDAGEWYTGVKARTTTAADGTYTVAAKAGSYLIQFVEPSGDYLWSFHLGDEYESEVPDSIFAARGFAVAAGETVRADHTLIRSGSLRGRITLPADADPADVFVTAWHPRKPTGMAPRAIAQWGKVAADGTFVVPLQEGEYVLDISHRDDLFHEMSLPVRVNGTAITTNDVAPQRSATISGVVKVPAGSAATDVRVTARWLEADSKGNSYWSDGKSIVVKAGEPYRLAGLSTNTYRVEFAPDTPDSSLAPSYWPGVSYVEQGTDVLVLDGHDVPGVDGELAPGGEVTGRVDPALGLDPESSRVQLWRQVISDRGEPTTWQPTTVSRRLEVDGSFRLSGIPAGRYRLKADVRDREVFHPAATSLETGKDFNVALGRTTTGIDVGVPEVDPPADPVLKKIKRSKAPKVTGEAKVGKTLRVSRGSWKPKSVTVKYRWYVKKGKKAVKVRAATKSKLKLKKSTRGKKYRVVVTVSKKGYKTVRFTSKWSKKVKR